MRRAVFVHGVPDTGELWDGVLAALERDHTTALRLPGFAAPVPDGFTCTKEEYAAWIADEVRTLGEPVDLVGHDWGAMLVQRVATTEPDLVRTYTLIDGGVDGPMQWHDLATQWQTPDVGEQVMELMTPEAVEAVMRDHGHPDPAGCGARVDDAMKHTVLRLYRSAVDVGAEWAPGAAARARPLLVLWGRDDPFGKLERGEEITRTGDGRLVALDGGHWAAFTHPERTAAELEGHWASVPGG